MFSLQSQNILLGDDAFYRSTIITNNVPWMNNLSIDLMLDRGRSWLRLKWLLVLVKF